MSTLILNAEDSLDDVLLLRRACRKAEAQLNFHFVEDGEAAMDYLLGRGDFKDRSLPALILLDLNLPRKNGLEVLAWIKANVQFRHIPVAIFTSSTNPDDIRRAVENGADCYLAKPLDFDALILLLKRLDGVLRGTSSLTGHALASLPECCLAREGERPREPHSN